MRFDQLIGVFAERRGLRGVLPDASGAYVFTFDESFEVAMQARSRTQAVLSAELAPLPADPDDAEERLRKALRVGLARMRERPEVLTVAGNRLLVYLPLTFPDLDVEAFEEVVETFLQSLEDWKSALAEAPRPPAAFTMLYP
jgi:hypothetical protein